MCTSLSSRTSLLALNTIFFFCGAGIFAIGLWSQYDKNFAALWNSFEVSKVIDAKALYGASLLLILSGLASVLVSFVGMYGAFKNDRCFLTTYCLFICAILIVEIAAAAVFISYQSEARDKLREGLNLTVNKINAEEDKISLKVMDTIQTVFQCCGCEGPNDYRNLTQMKSCETKKSTAYFPDYYQNGCFMTIINYIGYHLPIIITLSVGMIVFQIFLMLVSTLACSNLRHNGYEDI